MALPAYGYLSNDDRDGGEMKQGFEDQRDAIAMIPGVGVTVQDLTISGNAIQPAAHASLVVAVTQSGTTADTLRNIVPTNVVDGSFLKLFKADQNITIDHNYGGAGNIILVDGADFLLDTAYKHIMLRYDSSVGSGTWYEVFRCWGDQTSQEAVFRTHFGMGDVCDGINVGTSASNVPQCSDIYGADTIWVPADSMYPETTAACSTIDQVELTAGQPERRVLWFDGTSLEAAQFSIGMPKSWDEGTLYARFFFAANHTGTGTVIWQIAAVALDHSDPLQTAFGTAQPVTTTLTGTANDVNVSAWLTTPITVAGTPSDGDLTVFRVTRDAASDTDNNDAGLIGLQLRYLNDALNDD